MPIDGDVDASTRTRLNASVQKLARELGGSLTTASATFGETASMVGCDPHATGCTDTVLTTLQADEIVWGTATTSPDGTITFVVHRASRGVVPHEQTAQIAPNDPPDRAEATLQPLFGGRDTSSSGTVAPPGAGPNQGGVPPRGSGVATRSSSSMAPWSRDKKLGIGLAVGGGAALLIGLALWASESSVQSQIDSAPTNTLADIQSLKSLEGTAEGYAWSGNVMVVIGLAAGGAATYYLWRDHQAHLTVAPVPVDHGTGATFVMRGSW
jgi:hypothetical protein